MTGIEGCPVKLDAKGNREKCMEAEKAATAAVHRTFAIMGIDVDDPVQVRDFQEGLAFNRKLNIIANKTAVGIVLSIFTVIIGIILQKIFQSG